MGRNTALHCCRVPANPVRGPARHGMYERWCLYTCFAATALVQLSLGCIVIELNPSGFHANVNNLLALIPLVAHLHNDTVHYRLKNFHYKCEKHFRFKPPVRRTSIKPLCTTACRIFI